MSPIHSKPRAIDCWVNVHMGDFAPPAHLVRVKEDYLHGDASFFRSFTPEEMLEVMDEHGIERAIISYSGADNPRSLDFVERFPERFSLAIGVNPTKLMPEVWRLESLVRNLPVVLARVIPFDSQVAPSDAVYYPLYAKCVELDLPLSINTGLPGPPVPGECQDPIHLDKVCFRFPELKLCMAHGADPWWSVAIRLMIKYANLHMITSAWSPKRLPPELLHFMRTRGQNKVIWASDHPALTIQRTLPAAWELDLPAEVLDKYLYGNADRLFFSPRRPRY